VPEVEHVAVGLHRDADSQHRHAVVADRHAGRVFVAGAHGGDVGQPEQAASDFQRHVGNVGGAAQPAVDAHLHAVMRGIG
jgi:hypothetical protein